DGEARAVDHARGLAAGRIGQAEMDALAPDAGHPVIGVAEEGFGLRLPDELHALFLRMRDLALRARHVAAIAAIDAVHGDGALAHRGAHAIHRGVAAADHDHALAARIERAGIEVRHAVAEPLAVAGGEVRE